MSEPAAVRIWSCIYSLIALAMLAAIAFACTDRDAVLQPAINFVHPGQRRHLDAHSS